MKPISSTCRLIAALVLSSAGLGFAVHAQAADYPSKAVRIVVPFPPGGTVDPPVRVLAEHMSRAAGVPFVIDNKIGAGGDIAIKNVIGSPPDGYSILIAGATLPISAALYKPARFDPLKDFTHIGRATVAPAVIAVNNDSPIKTLQELIDKAREQPGKVRYGSPGIGSGNHVFMESVGHRAGVRFLHAPYKGSAGAVIDLIGNHIDVIAVGLSSAGAQIKAGQLRALAVTSVERSPDFPNVPTVSETFPDLQDQGGIHMSGPAGLPPEIVQKFSELLKNAVADPQVQKRLRDMGQYPSFLTPTQATDLVKGRTAFYADVIEKLGIKPQ